MINPIFIPFQFFTIIVSRKIHGCIVWSKSHRCLMIFRINFLRKPNCLLEVLGFLIYLRDIKVQIRLIVPFIPSGIKDRGVLGGGKNNLILIIEHRRKF